MASTYYDFLIGTKVGRLTILENLHTVDSDRRTLYRCICDCGNEVITSGKHIASGNTKSCGCLQKDITSKRSTLDLTNTKFGRLQPLYIAKGKKCAKQNIWVCLCDCGNIVEVPVTYLTTGDTKSCGCIEKEKSIKASQLHWTKLQSIRSNMIHRCYNPKCSQYCSYGDRGITVCDEWLDEETGKDIFYNWAITHRYKEGLTIDRIDVNGNYEPNNCRWVTKLEQCWNKRDTKRTKDGFAIAQYCNEYGVESRYIYDNFDVENMYLFEIHNYLFYTPFYGLSEPIM